MPTAPKKKTPMMQHIAAMNELYAIFKPDNIEAKRIKQCIEYAVSLLPAEEQMVVEAFNNGYTHCEIARGITTENNISELAHASIYFHDTYRIE